VKTHRKRSENATVTLCGMDVTKVKLADDLDSVTCWRCDMSAIHWARRYVAHLYESHPAVWS
jgi:hypothetical protein